MPDILKGRPSDHIGCVTNGKLKVTYVPIHKLRPSPENPRQHSRKQIREIARSIKSFGFGNPLLVDKNFEIIAGHGRLLAAKQLNIDPLPVICLEDLTSA